MIPRYMITQNYFKYYKPSDPLYYKWLRTFSRRWIPQIFFDRFNMIIFGQISIYVFNRLHSIGWLIFFNELNTFVEISLSIVYIRESSRKAFIFLHGLYAYVKIVCLFITVLNGWSNSQSTRGLCDLCSFLTNMFEIFHMPL